MYIYIPLVIASAISPWSSFEVKVLIPPFPADFRISSVTRTMITVNTEKQAANQFR